MRNELWAIAVSAAVGIAMGGSYFGGLWFTVRRMPESQRPMLLLLGSFAIRGALTVLVVLALLWAPWGNLAALLIGMIAARLAIGRMVKLRVERQEPGTGNQKPRVTV